MAAAFAAYVALIASIQPYDDGCYGELGGLYETGYTEHNGVFLFAESCSSFDGKGVEVSSATIIYWIPWVLGPAAAIGAWFAVAGLVGRTPWRRAFAWTAAATAVFFGATFAFFSGAIGIAV